MKTTQRPTTKSSSLTLHSKVSTWNRTWRLQGAEAGSLVSTITQAIIFRTRIQSTTFFRGNLWTTVGLSLATTAAGYYKVKTADPAFNYDRAFRYVPRLWQTVGTNVRLQHSDMQNRCDKYAVMFTGTCLLMTLWIFPIPRFKDPRVIEKALGIGTFGTGLGALSHWLTSKSKGGLDPINFWRNWMLDTRQCYIGGDVGIDIGIWLRDIRSFSSSTKYYPHIKSCNSEWQIAISIQSQRLKHNTNLWNPTVRIHN